MFRRVQSEIQRLSRYFRLYQNKWHIIGFTGVALLFVGGIFWSQASHAGATTTYPHTLPATPGVLASSGSQDKDFAMIKKDGVWHVFAIYACAETQGIPCLGLMHVHSTDLTNWTEDGYVIPPSSDAAAWNSLDIWAPTVVKNPTDGKYYLFYTGVKKDVNGVREQRIGVATSTNLYDWDMVDYPNPVVDCSTFSWTYYKPADTSGDAAACRDPYVNWDPDQGQWVMTMATRGNNPGSYAWTPGDVMIAGIATSHDLIHWTDSGYITQTKGYKLESPHFFKHGSTWYLLWTGDAGSPPDYVHGLYLSNRNIHYSTSSSLYSGFSAGASFAPADYWNYASEYYDDGAYQYFASVMGSSLDFYSTVWSGDAISLYHTPEELLKPHPIASVAFGKISGTVWADTNGDGVRQNYESGKNGVTITLYEDDGDGKFDVTKDGISPYVTTTTGDDPNTVGTQTGYYGFTNVLPGTYWVSIDSVNYSVGHALAGYAPRIGSNITKFVVGEAQSYSSQDIVFGADSTVWDLNNVSMFTTNGVIMANGRATITSGTGTLQPVVDQPIPFSRLKNFDADVLEQGGVVHFVLSNDNGTSWLYWNGSGWVLSDSSVSQSSSVPDIRTNAMSFPAGAGEFLWRAVLQSPSDAPAILLRVGVLTNSTPAIPIVVCPTNGQVETAQPQLCFSSTDPEGEGMQFVVDLDTMPTFTSSNYRRYSQSSSQFGWLGQNNGNLTMFGNAALATLTINNPLTPGTWYWRVAAEDPLGSDLLSVASTTHSFVVPAPVTLGLITTRSTTSSITVSWTTNTSVTSSVQFGATTAYGSQTETSAGITHTATISGLAFGTKYHLRVTADAGSGQTIRSGDIVAQTNVATISGITVMAIGTSITVRWQTDIAVPSSVLFGTTTAYGGQTMSRTSTDHEAIINGLKAGATYHLRVVSDAGNGWLVQSGDVMAQTAGTSISGISVTTTKNSATITWMTTDSATTKVLYRKSSLKTDQSISSKGLTRQHKVTLAKLSAKTKYQYQILSTGSSIAKSTTLFFTTKAK